MNRRKNEPFEVVTKAVSSGRMGNGLSVPTSRRALVTTVSKVLLQRAL